jgi:hypothetical protein
VSLLAAYGDNNHTVSIPCAVRAEAEKADAQRHRLVVAKRELGRMFVSSALELLQREGSRMSDLDDVLLVRKWLLSDIGFGNLVVNFALEDVACKTMFRIVTDGTNDLDRVAKRMVEVTEGTPHSRYWHAVMRQEEVSANISTRFPDKTNDCFRVMEILESLMEAQPRGWASPIPQTLTEVYDKGTIFQMPMHVLTVSLRKSSLEAFIEIRRHSDLLPDDRKALDALARKHARGLMQKTDRIGGRIDAVYLWDLWQGSLSQ